MTLSSSLLNQLQQTTGLSLRNPRICSIGGGDINAAYRVKADGVDWFVKLNRASLTGMFAAEAAGLQELARQQHVRVPGVISQGKHGDQAYLVLEYVELSSLRGKSAALFGQQLAALHRQPQPYFGWHIDNTIGSTPQHNDRSDDWLQFWSCQRLGKQLKFAAANGFGGSLQRQGEKLIDKLPALFSDYQPYPSLLHGDLWAGNAAASSCGEPIIFDPACYYGDREADMAMTELFGGFGREFYDAYQQAWPLDAGYNTRKTLYNLYHILNHLNLFGAGYLRQSQSMIEQLLAEMA